MKIALIGPGKMGRALSMNMTKSEEVIIIGRTEPRAKALSEDFGWPYSLDIKDIKDADVCLFVLELSVLNPVMAQAAPYAKKGAIFVNVCTKATIDPETIQKFPDVTFVDGKMVSSAIGVQRGLPGYMVVGTKDEEVYKKVKACLPGLKDVVMGDTSLIAKINSFGSKEGIRMCVRLQTLLKDYDVPQEWKDQVINSVALGTAQAYMDNILGEFAQKLADELRAELAAKNE